MATVVFYTWSQKGKRGTLVSEYDIYNHLGTQFWFLSCTWALLIVSEAVISQSLGDHGDGFHRHSGGGGFWHPTATMGPSSYLRAVQRMHASVCTSSLHLPQPSWGAVNRAFGQATLPPELLLILHLHFHTFSLFQAPTHFILMTRPAAMTWVWPVW